MKLLNLDIENLPAVRFDWDIRKPSTASLNQVLSPQRIVCMAYQWIELTARQGLVPGPMKFTAEWKAGGAPKFAANVHKLLSEADAVVSYNGAKFDVPKLNGFTTQHGFSASPAPVHVDLFRTVRKLGLMSSKLDHALEVFLGLSKMDTGGFELWRGVYFGEKWARDKMEAYNRVDVERVTQLMEFFLGRGFDLGIPHLGLFEGTGTPEEPSCPTCGRTEFMIRQGVRLTKKGIYQRWQCTDDGRWSSSGRATDRRDVG